MLNTKSNTYDAEEHKPLISFNNPEWAGINSEIGQYIRDLSRKNLEAYKVNPKLVEEHANTERSTSQGGYGRRQIYELIQNGADALLNQSGGKVKIVLSDDALYCANEGNPLTSDGVDSILYSHISKKRGDEIGRFGLGFKSVLGVTDRPEIYSRTGSFGFNPDYSQKLIKEIGINFPRYPVLRIAFPIDPSVAAQSDPILADLMQWAMTIIKIPRTMEAAVWLSDDLKNFPSEFLVFSPHVDSLILEDVSNGIVRNISLSKIDGQIHLSEGSKQTVWRVFKTEHSPSPLAKQDGGELADRKFLPIMWAVPFKEQNERGRFWAFFPTEYYTTLSGILNAPWKTNEDRQNLLPGAFNDELLDTAARLIAKSVEELADKDDPGSLLDLLPARGREAPNVADAKITEWVYKYVALEKSLPDQTGKLCYPKDLNLNPEKIPENAIKIWAEFPERPINWCHHSVNTYHRRSRAERLLKLANNDRGPEWQPATLKEWLEAITAINSPRSSIVAIRTAAAVLAEIPTLKKELQGSKIVLLRDGSYVPPMPKTIFIPDPTIDNYESELNVIHPEISEDNLGLKALEELGITKIEASSELQALLVHKTFLVMTPKDWAVLWSLARLIPIALAKRLLDEAAQKGGKLHVRTLSGSFKPIDYVLLPGEIVPEDGSRDTDITIDTNFHATELFLIKELGAVTGPTVKGGSINNSREEIWFKDYRNAALSIYYQELPSGSTRPNESYLDFENDYFIGPIEPLFSLSDEGKCEFTEAVVALANKDTPWYFSHTTREGKYPSISIPSPTIWAIKKYGKAYSTLGLNKVDSLVSPKLKKWGKFFPIPEWTDKAAELFDLPQSLENIVLAKWKTALEKADDINDEASMADFYATAARYVAAPHRLKCRLGLHQDKRPPKEITVVCDTAEITALEDLKKPFLKLNRREEAEILIQKWGLLPTESSLTINLYPEPSGTETPLLDKFPALNTKLGEGKERLKLIPCSSLRREVLTSKGRSGEEKEIVLDGENLYYSDRLTSTNDLLDRIITALNINLSLAERQETLKFDELINSNNLLVKIRTANTLPEKLLLAVGVEALRMRLPAGLLAIKEKSGTQLNPLQVSKLVLDVFGLETFKMFKEIMQSKGLQPPVQWAGSHSAKSFVIKLGIPIEYAGFEGARRDPLLEVEGPPNLPQLHEFQKAIVSNVKTLVTASKGKRGLLSLPTGAGKTRVVVEALVELIREDYIFGKVLWVAQSDELCEQAVQTWSYVWRAVGGAGTLCINRLWASNEADPSKGAQVVIATIDKLQNCIKDPNYEWLKKTECIIIDEAHGSITTEYTALLTWLEMGRNVDNKPLIGLTATPFRGGEEETKRLVNRYGRTRLDSGVLGDDPYRELQKMGVLSWVDHQELPGIEILLDENELDELRKTTRIPTTALDRIGANVKRNLILLDSIKKLDPTWSILLFSVSVDHAQTMAALLMSENISAAAISGHTDPAVRRRYIEDFRRKKIRVLTNYGVLTTGFDAPAVRAVFVARPTYSPVVYQQMIGRGLRGPLNGGKERCLIVNVRDNIQQYGEALAFTQFEYLWKETI